MPFLQALTRVAQTFHDQRRSQREYVQFPAWIDICNGAQPLDCTVLDVSEDGARIEGLFPARLPEKLFLVLNKQGTRRRRCRMVWRRNQEIGLAYLGPLEIVRSSKLPF